MQNADLSQLSHITIKKTRMCKKLDNKLSPIRLFLKKFRRLMYIYMFTCAIKCLIIKRDSALHLNIYIYIYIYIYTLIQNLRILKFFSLTRSPFRN